MRVERVRNMVDVDGKGEDMEVTELAAKRGNQDYAALKGKAHPFKHKKAKLPKWSRRIKDADGADLVEVQRTRVLRMKRVGDAVLPEETEQVDLTGVGEVKQRVTWKHKGDQQ
jgi:hypothetical protein